MLDDEHERLIGGAIEIELLSMHHHWINNRMESIAFSPAYGWIHIVYAHPWYRLDLRLRDWMDEWDVRFAERYSCR